MKRIFLFLLCAVFLSLPLANVYAELQSQITPRVIPDVKVSVTIKQSGNSVIGTAIVTTNPLLTVTTTVYMEQNDGSGWECVSTNVGGTRVTVTTIAESGTSYRVYVTCTVKDAAGNVVDTLTGYSNTLAI